MRNGSGTDETTHLSRKACSLHEGLWPVTASLSSTEEYAETTPFPLFYDRHMSLHRLIILDGREPRYCVPSRTNVRSPEFYSVSLPSLFSLDVTKKKKEEKSVTRQSQDVGSFRAIFVSAARNESSFSSTYR